MHKQYVASMMGQAGPPDPAEVWARKLSRSHHRARLTALNLSSEQFWDGFDRWPEYLRYIAYPGRVLDRILGSVTPQSTVLDIGAGSGALTIPLAGAAKSVTAVEPSSGQIARLLESANASGISNLSVIRKRWEEISLEEIGTFGIVTAGYCLQMEDIRTALEKMRRAACERVFIVHFAGHDMLDDLARITGRFDPGPDHRDLMAVLFEMGYRPEVEIIRRHFTIPLRLQMEVFAYSLGLSPEEREALFLQLRASGRVVDYEGTYRVKRWYDDALITF